VASGPCHDRPNHVARFAAQRQIGNFGMISQIAAKNLSSAKPHVLAAIGFVLKVLGSKQLTTESSGLSANARMTGVAC